VAEVGRALRRGGRPLLSALGGRDEVEVDEFLETPVVMAVTSVAREELIGAAGLDVCTPTAGTRLGPSAPWCPSTSPHVEPSAHESTVRRRASGVSDAAGSTSDAEGEPQPPT